ncbi:MAG: hypothetical protein WC796_03830 [Candidatus Pacearchaeota archaeon]|jgi:hypothetical protein
MKQQSVEELVRLAKISLSCGRDKKYWVYVDELQLLLEAGAKYCKKNSFESDDRYTQEVLYEGIIFQTVTEHKLD